MTITQDLLSLIGDIGRAAVDTAHRRGHLLGAIAEAALPEDVENSPGWVWVPKSLIDKARAEVEESQP